MSRHLTANALLVAALVLAQLAGNALATTPAGVLPLRLEGGIAIAALALHGAAMLPGVVVGEALCRFLIWPVGPVGGLLFTLLALVQFGGGAWMARHGLGRRSAPAIALPARCRYPVQAAVLCGVLAALFAGMTDTLAPVPEGGVALRVGVEFVAMTLGTLAAMTVALPALSPGDFGIALRRRPLIGALSTLVVMVFVAFFSERSRADTDLRSDLRDAADSAALHLEVSLQSYIVALRAVEALFASSSNVTREEFDEFARSLQAPLPGLYAVAWDAYVDAKDREGFEQRMRATGLPDFRVFEVNAEGHPVPVPPRPYYVPVAFARYEGEPLKALGYDMASEPTRKAALDQALLTGEPTASGRIRLITDPDPGYDILILMTMRGAERGALIGYSGLAVRVSELYAATRRRLADGLELRLFDRSAESEKQWLHGLSPEWAAPAEAMRIAIRLPVAGRDWELEITALPAYLADRFPMRALLLLWGGLALSLVFANLLLGHRGPAPGDP